jgi:MFS family permease
MGYGLGFWLPSLLERSYALGLTSTAHVMAALLLMGATTGMLLGGVFADRLGRKDRAFYAWLPAGAYLLCVPLYAAGIAAPDLDYGFVLLLIPTALSYLWLGPVIVAVQHLVDRESRATASALFLIPTNLVGLGVGVPLLGKMSDILKPHYGTESLRYAIFAGLGFYALAALLMTAAGIALRRDWVEDAGSVIPMVGRA